MGMRGILFVDGKEVGQVGLGTILFLPPGQHVMDLRNSQGQKRWEKVVMVVAGDQVDVDAEVPWEAPNKNEFVESFNNILQTEPEGFKQLKGEPMETRGDWRATIKIPGVTDVRASQIAKSMIPVVVTHVGCLALEALRLRDRPSMSSTRYSRPRHPQISKLFQDDIARGAWWKAGLS